MTIYISGGITGVENYKQHFQQAEDRLIDQGYDLVVNPAKVNDELPIGSPYNMYMDVSIAMLSHCGAIYMLEGWESSKGANHELHYAKTYGLKIIYEGKENN